MLLNTHLLDLSWSVSFSSSAMKCSLGSRGGFPSCKGTLYFQQTTFLTLWHSAPSSGCTSFTICQPQI